MDHVFHGSYWGGEDGEWPDDSAPKPPTSAFQGGDDDANDGGGGGRSGRSWTILMPFNACAARVGGRGFKGNPNADLGAFLNDDPMVGLMSDSENPLRTSAFSDF